MDVQHLYLSTTEAVQNWGTSCAIVDMPPTSCNAVHKLHLFSMHVSLGKLTKLFVHTIQNPVTKMIKSETITSVLFTWMSWKDLNDQRSSGTFQCLTYHPYWSDSTFPWYLFLKCRNLHLFHAARLKFVWFLGVTMFWRLLLCYFCAQKCWQTAYCANKIIMQKLKLFLSPTASKRLTQNPAGDTRPFRMFPPVVFVALRFSSLTTFKSFCSAG